MMRTAPFPHTRFTVGPTRIGAHHLGLDYAWAIFHQAPPRDLGNGTMSISLRFPFLIAGEALNGQQATLNQIAQILNANWPVSQLARTTGENHD